MPLVRQLLCEKIDEFEHRYDYVLWIDGDAFVYDCSLSIDDRFSRRFPDAELFL